MTERHRDAPRATTILGNGRLVDRSGRYDISVVDGRIDTIEPSTSPVGSDRDRRDDRRRPKAATVVDLGGRLVMPALVEPHAHLDKALLAGDVTNPTGDLPGAIEAMEQAAAGGGLSPEAVAGRAAQAVEMLVARGVTTVRSHLDVGDSVGADSVTAVAGVRDRYRDVVDLELVALTHSPITGPDGAGNRRALDRAVEAGVDVIGGCPHLEHDPQGSIDVLLTVADEAGMGLDLHMDETLDPAVFHLDYLARRILDTGFERSVTAGHCVTLGLQDLATQQATARLLAEAGVAVVALPQTNLFLQGREHPVAMPRALAPIAVLEDAGVTVAAGGDNVQDPFNPMGRGDQLEIANLLVLLAHRSPRVALAMVGSRARSLMGREPVEVSVGHRADLMAVAASGVGHALATQPHDRLIFRSGRPVASSTATTTLIRHRRR